MKKKRGELFWAIAWPLLGLSTVSVLFLLARLVAVGNLRYFFLPWNLVLAWLPLLFIFWLRHLLKSKTWLSWQAIGVTALWLFFLPNSFYILTDLIHIHQTYEISILFDVVTMSLFVVTGLLLGFVALLIFQRELSKRVSSRTVHAIVFSVILLISFAIYLGRYLRWNSWDVFGNPLGLLFDVTDRIVSPSSHPMTFTTTAMFFLFISTFYFGTLGLVKALRPLLK